MKIRTKFEYPPVPSRQFDWSAIDEDTYDGAEDSKTRGQIGTGATEQEAINDLMEQLGLPQLEASNVVPDDVKRNWPPGYDGQD